MPSLTNLAVMCLAVAAPQGGSTSRFRPEPTELRTAEGRDALARVAYAEAGKQGDSGLAGVVYTITNRLIDGSFGATLPAVLNGPNQFEPVSRARASSRH